MVKVGSNMLSKSKKSLDIYYVICMTYSNVVCDAESKVNKPCLAPVIVKNSNNKGETEMLAIHFRKNIYKVLFSSPN